jgi:hypothetical protein
LDNTFYKLVFKQEIVAAPVTSIFPDLLAFLEKHFFRNTIQYNNNTMHLLYNTMIKGIIIIMNNNNKAIIQLFIIIMEGCKALFCFSNFTRAGERVSSKFTIIWTSSLIKIAILGINPPNANT